MKEARIIALLIVSGFTWFVTQNGAIASSGEAAIAGGNTVTAPLVNEKYEYYDVNGNCEKDLHCQLKKRAIRWNDGNMYDSVTSWKITWNYDYNHRPGSCYTDSFRVSVDMSVRLPKWAPPDNVPHWLVEKWGAYIQKLLTHEKGHRDMVLKAASEVTESVAELPPSQSCEELDRKVHALCRERIKRLNEDQQGYDTATSHGHFQGISFP